MERKTAWDDTPQRERTRSAEHGSQKPAVRGREVKREWILFHGCALAPDQAKRGRFSVSSQAPASATLFTSCLFIATGSKPDMGRCDLYAYKLPKGTGSWQGKDRDRGKPPTVKMPITPYPPTLTLNVTKGQRPGPGNQAMHGQEATSLL